ncbi:hypothetical protein ALP89_05692 [Pseudomonas syringae pv. persicae]|nr:hypothetical protein ALP89_05692 [Pseudomonas syringae pv. persicae]
MQWDDVRNGFISGEWNGWLPEPANRKSLKRDQRRARADPFGQRFACRRADLETCSGKTETVQQTGLGQAWPKYRFAIRQVAFGAAPGADGLGTGQRRVKLDGIAQDVEHRCLAGSGACRVNREALTTAEHAIAARHLPGVDAAAFDPGADVHEHWQRFGDQHCWMPRIHWHRFVELRRQRASPGTCAVEQPGCPHLQAIGSTDDKSAAVMDDLAHRCLLEHLRSCLASGAGKGGRYQTRIGVPVVSTQRRTDGHIARPGVTGAQLLAIQQLQVQAKTLTGLRIGTQGIHVVFAARQLKMAGALVFTVDAYQLTQAAPDLVRPLRQGQLRQGPTLTAHAAVVDAAGVRATEIALQQGNALAFECEAQGCRRADNAAADDNHIGFNQRAHGRLSTDCLSTDCTSTPNGSGLMGAWPRKRPTCCTGRPLSRAMISTAARPHMRPWQRPMPTRHMALTRLICQ